MSCEGEDAYSAMTTWHAEGAAATAFDIIDYAKEQCSALSLDCSKEPVFQDLRSSFKSGLRVAQCCRFRQECLQWPGGFLGQLGSRAG